MIYTEETWAKYVNKIEDKFRLKTYPHFDHYFHFPQEKNKLQELLKNTSGHSIAEHSFLPLVKILIKIPRYRYQEEEDCKQLDTKIRPISFASHFDNYIYGFYAFALNEIYQKYIKESGFGECILAYRNDLGGKCNIQFAKEIFDIIKEKGTCTAIALDIHGYFDSIDHNILKEKWCKLLGVDVLPHDQYKIFRSLTKYSYVNKNTLLKHFKINLDWKRKHKEDWQTLLDLVPDEKAGKCFQHKFELLRKDKLIVQNKPKRDSSGEIQLKGIPQGSAMSALLSNVYLIDFDEYLQILGQKMGFAYRRYCDDMLIICRTKETNSILSIVTAELQKKYRLRIQDKKTEIRDFMFNEKGIIRAFTQEYDDSSKTYFSLPNADCNYKNLQYLGFEFNGQNIYLRASSLSRYFRKMKGRIVKTVVMARSKKSKSTTIYKRQIYHRYSHLGKHNFIKYAFNAAKKYYKNANGDIKEGMDSVSIRKQLSSHFSIIEQEIKKTSGQIRRKRSEVSEVF